MSYPGTIRVVKPGDPESSSLYRKLAAGQMPLTGPRLPKEDIQVVYDWIKNGAHEHTPSGGIGTGKQGELIVGMPVGNESGALTIKTKEGKKQVHVVEDMMIEGQRIRRRSQMPDYKNVLTVKDFEDILSYVAGLTGEETEIEDYQKRFF